MWLSTLCTFHLFSFTNWLHVHITESVMDCIINYQQLGFWNLPAACFLCSKVCGTMSPTWPLLLQQYYNNHQTTSRPTCYILFYHHHHHHCAWWPRSAIGGNWAIFHPAPSSNFLYSGPPLLPPPLHKISSDQQPCHGHQHRLWGSKNVATFLYSQGLPFAKLV